MKINNKQILARSVIHNSYSQNAMCHFFFNCLVNKLAFDITSLSVWKMIVTVSICFFSLAIVLQYFKQRVFDSALKVGTARLHYVIQNA